MSLLDYSATTAWLELAACRGRPTEWWYPSAGDRFAIGVARSICRTCPVRAECLAEALELEGDLPGSYRYGIRGGLTAEQRRRRHSRLRDHGRDHGASS